MHGEQRVRTRSARHRDGGRGPVLAGILVGGRSSRMGAAKGLVRVRGAAMAERVVAAVAPAVAGVVLLGDGPVPPGCADLPRLADAGAVPGPLAGMLAAVRFRPDVCWMFAACDMPLLEPALVRWLLGRRRSGAAAVVPLDPSGRPEPLLSLWEPSGHAIIERLAAGPRPAPRLAAEEPEVVRPRVPARLAGGLRNVNSAEDLARLAAAADTHPA